MSGKGNAYGLRRHAIRDYPVYQITKAYGEVRAMEKLPRIELIKPDTIIGKNTVASLQSGLVYGYIAMVDGIVEKIRKHVKTEPYVVATGGLADFMAEESKVIDEVDNLLTLKGLEIIYDKNKRGKP